LISKKDHQDNEYGKSIAYIILLLLYLSLPLMLFGLVFIIALNIFYIIQFINTKESLSTLLSIILIIINICLIFIL